METRLGRGADRPHAPEAIQDVADRGVVRFDVRDAPAAARTEITVFLGGQRPRRPMPDRFAKLAIGKDLQVPRQDRAIPRRTPVRRRAQRAGLDVLPGADPGRAPVHHRQRNEGEHKGHDENAADENGDPVESENPLHVPLPPSTAPQPLGSTSHARPACGVRQIFSFSSIGMWFFCNMPDKCGGWGCRDRSRGKRNRARSNPFFLDPG
jgi:hypothetical protein